MRLILHAGTHKTGTTTIQKVLYDNRDWLRQNRLFYPVMRPFRGKRPHHKFAHALASGRLIDRAKARLFIAATKWQADPGDTVVISSEPIYRHVSGGIGWDGLVAPDYWERRQSYLRSVAEVLSDFDVEVVLCFREYGYYLAWLHRMMKKNRGWEGSAREFRSTFADRFEYDRQIEAFRHFFPRIHTYSFEAARDGGIASSFFTAIGFPVPADADQVWERRSRKRIAPI